MASSSDGFRVGEGDEKRKSKRDRNARLIVSTNDSTVEGHSSARTLFESSLATGETITEDQYREALLAERGSDAGLSIYVHLPFCPSRCLTCDHETNVIHDGRQVDRYIDAIEREVQLITAHLGQGQPLQQLHFGGGTPNYLSEVQLVRLVDILDRHFTFSEDTVTSLEINAHRASFSQLMLLYGLGFRNLNLEIRDLDTGVQEALGRHQSLPVIRDVVESARKIGFAKISTDLVYGLPRQSVSSIRSTVEHLLTIAPDRINCHPYTRSANRFPHQQAISKHELPSLGDKVGIFSRIVDGFCEAGYEWIGLDCFARSEDQIAAAHRDGTLRRNWIGYNTLPGRSVLGLGSSSVSDLSTICLRNHHSLEQWRDCLESGTLPVSGGHILSAGARARRNALSDLMCNLSLDDGDNALFSSSDDPTLTSLQDEGLVEVDGRRISITQPGRYALHQLWGDSSPNYRWSHSI